MGLYSLYSLYTINNLIYQTLCALFLQSTVQNGFENACKKEFNRKTIKVSYTICSKLFGVCSFFGFFFVYFFIPQEISETLGFFIQSEMTVTTQQIVSHRLLLKVVGI